MKKRILNYRRVLPNALTKSGGFTLIEILVVTFIFAIIMGALIATLNTGQFSSAVGSARADLQAKIRTVIGLIIRDVRQTTLVEINSNTPSQNHIKFRKVTGIDGSGNYTLDTYYIEYTYNSALKELTRIGYDAAGGEVETTWGNITESPFYVAAGDPLAANNILTNKKLLIVINGESNAWGSLAFSLSEEVKIRNE